MQATGGDVVLKHSRPGEGTTFVVEIPCVSEGEITPSEKLPSKDILIVDDIQEWRDQLVDATADEYYSVETADSYAAASLALEKSHFKLAVVDIRLVDAEAENEDGLRLLADIDRAGLDTTIIIVTGYGTEQHRKTASQSPRLLAFIDKDDFNLTDFRSLVRQAVERSESSQLSQIR